ncbi:MAG: BTAD domain-containing putative transcriptional regulator [Acidimicrobiales bacterium]
MASSAQRLVAFVALHERAVPRLHASGALWAESSERRANSSLRSALWRVPSPAGVEVIEASDTHLWLNPRVSVDFKETVAWATSILDPAGTAEQSDDRALQLQVLRDDLLPEWYEDWVLVERERFRQLRLHALEAICERFTEEGKYGLALEAGLAAVAAEPLRESAHRLVVRVHLKEGNLAEASRQYRACARLLADALGARPSPSMDRLFGDRSVNSRQPVLSD